MRCEAENRLKFSSTFTNNMLQKFCMEEGMVDRILLERILADIHAYEQDLRDKQNISWDAFRTDKKLRR